MAKPPKGGERSEPVSRMFFMPYDTESKSRNVLASPLGEEGHEVAKGCTRVRMLMILDVDVTAERRHYNTHRPPKGETTHYILCTASLGGPPIGGQDRDGASDRCSAPYTLSRFAGLRPGGKHVTSRGNEKIGGTGYCVTYDTESQSRNADFISIARRAIRNPRPEGPSNLRTLRPIGPVHLKNPPS